MRGPEFHWADEMVPVVSSCCCYDPGILTPLSWGSGLGKPRGDKGRSQTLPSGTFRAAGEVDKPRPSVFQAGGRAETGWGHHVTQRFPRRQGSGAWCQAAGLGLFGFLVVHTVGCAHCRDGGNLSHHDVLGSGQ